jgi:hypothetical protein
MKAELDALDFNLSQQSPLSGVAVPQPARLHRLETVPPKYVEWRAGTATPLRGLS